MCELCYLEPNSEVIIDDIDLGGQSCQDFVAILHPNSEMMWDRVLPNRDGNIGSIEESLINQLFAPNLNYSTTFVEISPSFSIPVLFLLLKS
jgi:hypothetical protein